MNKRKIEVMLGEFGDTLKNPYFWCILQYDEAWHNVGCGWSNTPENAFSEALEYNKDLK